MNATQLKLLRACITRMKVREEKLMERYSQVNYDSANKSLEMLKRGGLIK